jgi:hypothetical protein
MPLDFLPLPEFLLPWLMGAAMAEVETGAAVAMVAVAETAVAELVAATEVVPMEAMAAEAPGQRAMGIVMRAIQPTIRASPQLLRLENLIRLAFPLIPLPTIRR